jgi:valyl-tRNA synthetase
MSKSLGTGIDPLDEIEAHGADAVRFGLLAMSSSQDVRYSAEKIQQGQGLANKMWNASRLVLLNAADVEPEPRPVTPEDRWIVSRLQRAITRFRERIETYDLSHAALDLYGFFYGDFCDWYLELAKPRLYEHEEEVSATVLHVLGQTLRLAHPVLPFVTEEINSFLPRAQGDLAVAPFPAADDALIDEAAEREVASVIEAVRRLRNYRDAVGAAAAARIPARLVASGEADIGVYERSLGAIARLARFDITVDGAEGDAVSSVSLEGATVEVLPSEIVDADEARARIEAQREKLVAEIARARGRLANDSFVEKAPPELVRSEREKLERFESELAELER